MKGFKRNRVLLTSIIIIIITFLTISNLYLNTEAGFSSNKLREQAIASIVKQSSAVKTFKSAQNMTKQNEKAKFKPINGSINSLFGQRRVCTHEERIEHIRSYCKGRDTETRMKTEYDISSKFMSTVVGSCRLH